MQCGCMKQNETEIVHGTEFMSKRVSSDFDVTSTSRGHTQIRCHILLPFDAIKSSIPHSDFISSIYPQF